MEFQIVNIELSDSPSTPGHVPKGISQHVRYSCTPCLLRHYLQKLGIHQWISRERKCGTYTQQANI
jgi:hypothetical protein